MSVDPYIKSHTGSVTSLRDRKRRVHDPEARFFACCGCTKTIDLSPSCMMHGANLVPITLFCSLRFHISNRHEYALRSFLLASSQSLTAARHHDAIDGRLHPIDSTKCFGYTTLSIAASTSLLPNKVRVTLGRRDYTAKEIA